MEQYPTSPGRRFVKYSLFDPLILLLIGFVVVGLLMIGFGWKHYAWQRTLQAHSIVATGIVTHVESRTSDNSTVYRPTVQFTPTDQTQLIIFESRMSTSEVYSEGETVKVLYPPDNPQGAELEKPITNPVFGYGFMILGVLIILFCGGGIKSMLTGFETTSTTED